MTVFTGNLHIEKCCDHSNDNLLKAKMSNEAEDLRMLYNLNGSIPFPVNTVITVPNLWRLDCVQIKAIQD